MAIGIEDAEPELGSCTALLGSELVPAAGFFIIRLAIDPARINQSGIRLRIGNPLSRRRSAPMQCLGRVLRRLNTVRKEKLAIAFRGFLVLLGRCPIPLCKARPLGRTAVEVQQTKLMLCFGMTRFGGAPIIGRCISETGKNTMPAGVKLSQPISRFRLPCRCCRTPFFERTDIIRPFIGLTSALDCRQRTAEANFRKPDHGSRIASLTPRISPLTIYEKTEREPMLISAVSVIPGTRRKLSGTPVSWTLVSATRAL